MTAPRDTNRRRPRVLIAGEFSAGKTRLITAMLKSPVLPSNVTSTALPPVWLVPGDGPRLAVQADGTTRRVTSPAEFDLARTCYGILAVPAPLLENFEIIDTPGHSDPDIPPDTWENMLSYADAVLWCSNATQAWRQSEKSVWQDMPERLREHATLLITHADRLADQTSLDRVMRRVRREAGAYFAHIQAVSLLDQSDVDSVARHLLEHTAGLPELGGAKNDLVASVAREAAIVEPAKTPRERQVAVARRVRTSPEIREAASPGAPQGPVRKLWNRLGGGTDADDAETLLARIDQLINLLDARAPDRRKPADPHKRPAAPARPATSLTPGEPTRVTSRTTS